MKAVEINMIQLLRDVGWASSNNEARRMIHSGGLYVEDERHSEEQFWFAGGCFIMRFGRRKYVRVYINTMREHYPQDFNDPPDSPDPGGTAGLGSMDDVGDKDE